VKLLCKTAERIWKDLVAYRQFVLAFLLYDIAVQLLFQNFCPFVIVTGFPCPGCGMTRAVFYFATGQFLRGWEMHPLGICWFLLAFWFCFRRYVLGKRTPEVLYIGGILAVFMLFVYGYRMYAVFPGKIPMAYTPKNLLAMLFPGYIQLADGIGQFLMNLRR